MQGGFTTMAKTPRKDQGPRLTNRDIDAMSWIAEQYTISLDHLQILLARLRDPEEQPGPAPAEEDEITDKRALKIVRRWQALGLAERSYILYGQPQWIWLTAQGLKLVESETGELRPHTPTAARIEHLYWTNHARLFIERKRPRSVWTSEREIRSTQGKTEPGKKRPHTPDAIVTLENGNRVAIEVELSTKAYSRLDKILHELALSDYNTVWYFCQGRAKKVIENALEDIRQQYNKFAVYDLDDLPI
jgi:hypothetical protein